MKRNHSFPKVQFLFCLLSSLTVPLLCCPARAQGTSLDAADFDPTELNVFLKQKRILVENATKVLRDKSSNQDVNGPMDQAAFLLGDLRVTDAVEVLCDNITFLPTPKPGQHRLLSSPETPVYYSCAYALVQIGEPSDIARILPRVISTTDDSTRSSLACWVLFRVRGSDAAVNLLKERRKSSGRDSRRRLDAAIKFIKSYHPTFGPPTGKSIFSSATHRPLKAGDGLQVQ